MSGSVSLSRECSPAQGMSRLSAGLQRGSASFASSVEFPTLYLTASLKRGEDWACLRTERLPLQQCFSLKTCTPHLSLVPCFQPFPGRLEWILYNSGYFLICVWLANITCPVLLSSYSCRPATAVWKLCQDKCNLIKGKKNQIISFTVIGKKPQNLNLLFESKNTDYSGESPRISVPKEDCAVAILGGKSPVSVVLFGPAKGVCTHTWQGQDAVQVLHVLPHWWPVLGSGCSGWLQKFCFSFVGT